MGPKILHLDEKMLIDRGNGKVAALCQLITEAEILFSTTDMELVGIEVTDEGTAVAIEQRKPLEYIHQLSGGAPKPVNVGGRLFVFYMVPIVQ